jgi:transposase, IS30 family
MICQVRLISAILKQKLLAEYIGVHPSTVGRELIRNNAFRGRTARVYVASNALRKTDDRHQQKPKQVLFTDEIKRHAVNLLIIDKWSPE